MIDEKPMDDFEKFDDLELQLRDGLQRREPPAGFAERVVQRAEHGLPAQRPLQMPARRSIPVAAQWAVAAMLVLGIGGSVMEERHIAERRAQRMAYEQTMTALQITSAQLERINQRVNGQR